ncbi:hypothetical protein DBR37_04805 [Herminiimonas sp. KBW02]|uniref:DUF58 domain-containing protein n=1 Tax=Herminiimonas sp. KBW02 TaxID=2153363 RepID=UPI000F590C78|nr:DUF58 domain-containing protein [Herminiimonas sp. KBW02]RQO35701.1 hypothetical protein DBR37_04805 [Herminiimonas sp. KBW02]
MRLIPTQLQTMFTQWTGKCLFRLSTAETGTVFLKQRRIFIMPTRAGLIFGLMLMVLFICSINYNLSLGFALTFLLASCAIVGMHLTFRNLAYLHLSPGRTSPVYAGEIAQFSVQLDNRRSYERYAIRLAFITDGAVGIPHFTDIPSHASSDVTPSTPASERGWLTAPRIRLQTTFPLGLLQAWAYWQPAMQVLVYPRPEADSPPLPLSAGTQTDGRGNAGYDDFAGIRAYQSGDSMRQLAWRQIARSNDGALVSKQFEGGAASELVLDYSKLPPTMDVEHKLARMTSWVLMAEAQGLPYAFHLAHLYLPPSIGPAHQAACLQVLALYGHAP